MGTSSDPIQDGSDEQQKRSEIYTYEAPWQIYAMNWSVRCDKKYHFAITSLLEQYPNRVEIVQLDESNGEIRSDPNLTFEHPYPHTKTIFIPDKECQRPDRLATSSDFLRLWRIADDHSRRAQVVPQQHFLGLECTRLSFCARQFGNQDEILAIDAPRKERALTLGRDRTMLLHKMSRPVVRFTNALLKKKPVFLLKNAHSVVASVITTNENGDHDCVEYSNSSTTSSWVSSAAV
ncbi:hypothetical protein Bca4012_013890 [Brassica carinata]